MERSIYYYAGMAVGIGIALGVIVLLVFILKKNKKKGSCQYDERQVLVRGTAFKYGFWTSLFYFVAFSLFQDVTNGRYTDNFSGTFLGICTSVAVWAIYAIWNDGYFSMMENPQYYVRIFVAVGLLNVIVGMRGLRHWESGQLNTVMNLYGAGLFALLLVVMGLKRMRDKKEQE